MVRAIPHGRVMAYGEVAARAGLPGRARFVARVLATTTERGLPWHRVVGSGGRLALAAESEAGARQRHRLAAEGLVIRGSRVVVVAVGEPPDLDVALWGPRAGPARAR